MTKEEKEELYRTFSGELDVRYFLDHPESMRFDIPDIMSKLGEFADEKDKEIMENLYCMVMAQAIRHVSREHELSEDVLCEIFERDYTKDLCSQMDITSSMFMPDLCHIVMTEGLQAYCTLTNGNRIAKKERKMILDMIRRFPSDTKRERIIQEISKCLKADKENVGCIYDEHIRNVENNREKEELIEAILKKICEGREVRKIRYEGSLRSLSEKELEIIGERYGIFGKQPKRPEEIAEIFNISIERVNQICNKFYREHRPHRRKRLKDFLN